MFTPPFFNPYAMMNPMNGSSGVDDINKAIKFYKKMKREMDTEGADKKKKEDEAKKKVQQGIGGRSSIVAWFILLWFLSPAIILGSHWAFTIMLANYIEALKAIVK